MIDNGNTLSETLDGVSQHYTYNAKNQLIEADTTTGITRYQYNNDGIRTGQTSGLDTTDYVVDSNRDYAQVIQEKLNGIDTVSYTYGDDLISQNRQGETQYYHYDGLGSTRYLSDDNGTITDSYDYEAFGQVLNESGSSENSYRFAGEQFDDKLDQYYLRARYYNQNSGRFTQMDTYMGNSQDPVTLHKYLYGNADPVNHTDPSGYFGLANLGASSNIQSILSNIQIDAGLNFLDAALDPDNADSNLLVGLSAMGGPAAFKLLSRFSAKFKRACNSFDGNTLVATENGLKPIVDIKIGEKVWAYNEKTGNKSLQEVVHLIQGEGVKKLVDIELMSGEVITATAEHPFYIPETQEWLDASELSINDALLNLMDSTTLITDIKEYSKLAKVFNLTVANDHTYYVGEYGVLSHNVGSCVSAYTIGISTTLQATRKSKGGLRGGHHAPYLWGGSVSNRIDGPANFYTGILHYNGRTEKKRKTFFPDSYSQAKVMSFIEINCNG